MMTSLRAPLQTTDGSEVIDASVQRADFFDFASRIFGLLFLTAATSSITVAFVLAREIRVMLAHQLAERALRCLGRSSASDT